MQKMKKILLMLPALVLMLSLATLSVKAHEGHDHGEPARPASTYEERKPAEGGGSSSRTPPEDELSAQQQAELKRRVRANEDRLRQTGHDLLMELRANRADARTADQRLGACENRKRGLQTKVDNINSNAQKHQKRIDEVFAKVVAYQKDKGLTIDNLDALVTVATEAQAQSKAAVEALSNLKPTIDCTKNTVASDVAAFKVAAAQTRDDLSAYKKAVKDILKAAEAAREGA